jgi:serine/threonine-protein kinase
MLIGRDIGPFHIERELGSGAMGTVYQACRRDTGERVAVKIIGIGQLTNETAVARFEREARILAQLKHPNIVRLILAGRYKRTPFFAMELVEGESLDRMLARRNNFSWQEVVEIGKQLCSALQHAHMKGIIHRDLKPSNVMVLPDGTVKLTDFGIAKDIDVTALTGANSTVGTAAYMSPEQCRGEKNLSPKSDLYSLGIMFYELLTGRKPFQAETPVDMFMLHVNGKFERPSRLVLDIPIWLDTLVCQLMEKQPDHRPYDAAMVERVLGEIEEKALAQKSAGVEVATARRIDRPGLLAEDSDREAARALRGAAGRRRTRRKSGAWHERVWVRAAALSTALVGLFAVLFFATRPPSADKLFADAQAAVADNDEQRAIDATQRYLDRVRGSDSEQARQVREWNRRFWTQKYERQLYNRFTSKLRLKAENEGQSLSDDALRQENDGDRDAAIQTWKRLKEAYESAVAPQDAAYAWVADKKLADLQGRFEACENQLRASIDDLRNGRKTSFEPKNQLERDYLTALYLDAFGDVPAARDRWERIRDDALQRSLDDRPWGVYAAIRARQARAVAPPDGRKELEARLEMLRQAMSFIESVRPDGDPSKRREAAALCRDIIALYARDPNPDVAEFATKAEARLKALTAAK